MPASNLNSPPAYDDREKLPLTPDSDVEDFYVDHNGYACLDASGRAPPAHKRLFMRARTASKWSKLISITLLLGSALSLVGLLIFSIRNCENGVALINAPSAKLDAQPLEYRIDFDPLIIDTRKYVALEVDIQGATDGSLVIIPSESDDWILNMDVTSANEKVLARSEIVVEVLEDEDGDEAVKVVASAPRWNFSPEPVRVLVTLEMPYNAEAPLKAFLFNAANHNVYFKSSRDFNDYSLDSTMFARDETHFAGFGYAHIATVNGHIKSQVPIQGKDVVLKTIHGDIDVMSRFSRNLIIASVNGNVISRDSTVVLDSQLRIDTELSFAKRQDTEGNPDDIVEVEVTETEISKVVEEDGNGGEKLDQILVEEHPVLVNMTRAQYEQMQREENEHPNQKSLIETILQKAKDALVAAGGTLSEEEQQAQEMDEKNRQEMHECDKGKTQPEDDEEYFAIDVSTTRGHAAVVINEASLPMMDNVYYEVTSVRGVADMVEVLNGKEGKFLANGQPLPYTVTDESTERHIAGVFQPRPSDAPDANHFYGQIVVETALGDAALEILVPDSE